MTEPHYVAIEEISRIKLAPGEVLVVKMSGLPSLEGIHRARGVFRSIFPDNEVLVTTSDIDIQHRIAATQERELTCPKS